MAGRHYFENGRLIAGPVGPTTEANKPWAAQMLGPTLLTPLGEKPTEAVLASKNKVALLFAGSWCPWCKSLEPKLQRLYKKVKEVDPNDTEVVLISSCADAQKFEEWRAQQCWPAIPYSRSQGEDGEVPIGYVRKAKRDTGKPQGKLGLKFGMASVPQLIVLDGKSGEVVSKKPMQQISNSSADGYELSDLAPASWLAAADSPELKRARL